MSYQAFFRPIQYWYPSMVGSPWTLPNHWDCLFLSYCGILMHLNSMQHIIAQCFVKIQQHPLGYMVLLLFSWNPQGAYKEQGFLYISTIASELHPCVLFMGNYTKGTLSFWDISFHVHLYLNCRHLIEELTFLVLKIGFLIFLYKPDSCCCCFFHVASFLIRSWTFDDFHTFLLKLNGSLHNSSVF